jgi:hypothetical protein
MDGSNATQKIFPVIPVRFRNEKMYEKEASLAEECRDLITLLSRKIETLCHEYSEDTDRVTHIRSLTLSLVTLNSLLKTLEQERHSEVGIFEDAGGFEYISVRACDMERFSTK